jgi:hypothetical protein
MKALTASKQRAAHNRRELRTSQLHTANSCLSCSPYRSKDVPPQLLLECIVVFLHDPILDSLNETRHIRPGAADGLAIVDKSVRRSVGVKDSRSCPRLVVPPRLKAWHFCVRRDFSKASMYATQVPLMMAMLDSVALSW